MITELSLQIDKISKTSIYKKVSKKQFIPIKVPKTTIYTDKISKNNNLLLVIFQKGQFIPIKNDKKEVSGKK